VINFNRFLFVLLFLLLFLCLTFCLLWPVFSSHSIIIPYTIKPFDICESFPTAWLYLKILYIVLLIHSLLIWANRFYSNLPQYFKAPIVTSSPINPQTPNGLSLYVGDISDTNSKVYIPEKGLYQNILITGTIGSGKTSSSMYPFTKQLIEYNHSSNKDRIGMLILDVKGSYYIQVQSYVSEFNRHNDFIVIELGGKTKYNPLDKPNLKPIVLANRLKTILTLFSPNTSDSYWLDKAEQVLAEAIKLCRLYNNNYVTFVELHKLINIDDYYKEKLSILRKNFHSGKMSHEDIYNLSSSINFFESEFLQLDSRVLSIIKSEITRITNTFISDFDVLNTFCPSKSEVTFEGFKEVINASKIVLLNMNISQYKNLSKIIATYLKLDFQSEILSQLATPEASPNVTAFICDEYHEYVTDTDAEFFAQSREARSINIVATQSYTSLLNSLKNEPAVKVIIQNLINKLWFQTGDSFTIEDVQKQIGKEDKSKISKSISENANETHFNYFTNSLNSKKSNVSESISTYTQTDFVYDTKFFTQSLETFTCLSFISDGYKIMTPTKIKMFPVFNPQNGTLNINHKKNYKII